MEHRTSSLLNSSENEESVDPNGMLSRVVRMACIAVALALPISVSAQQTSFVRLDPSFNNSGFRLDRFEQTGQNSFARAATIQPDGKIVIAGAVYLSGFYEFGLARYNVDGTPDTTFSDDGKLNWNAGNLSDRATAVLVQPDGKILVGGSSANEASAVVLRFNADGSIDPTFGSSGKVTLISSSSAAKVRSIAIQPDGRILAVTGTQMIFRLNSNGSMDTTFDGDGQLNIFPTRVYSVAVQPDGKIVGSGYTEVSSGVARFCVLRLNADGSADTTFNGTGRSHAEIAGTAYAVALQTDGKIAAGGSTQFGETTEWQRDFAPSKFAIARFNADGTPDQSFSGDGWDTQNFLYSDWQVGRSLHILPDGKLLMGGLAYADNYDAGLMRYNTDGSLDKTFDLDGRALVYYDAFHDKAGATAVDASGRLIVAGYRQAVLPDVLSVMRANIGPSREKGTRFDQDGDGRADLAVWRSTNSMWYTQAAESFTYTAIGAAGDEPVPGDFDGDGNSDIAVWRPSNGQWIIVNSATATIQMIGWGQTGDVPIATDLSGDGRSNPVIYRPGNRGWYTWLGNGGWAVTGLGSLGDEPVLGDFDNDGIGDRALYGLADHMWKIERSGGGNIQMVWGEAGDIPVPADYDGDGATDIAVWRPSTGRWYIIGSAWGWMTWNVWGEPGDVPVPADYDGDGRTDIAIFRPSNSSWYIANSSDNSIIVRQFGAPGDLPIPAAYNY